MMNILFRVIDNFTSEYNKNPRLAQLVVAFVVFSIILVTYSYKSNRQRITDQAAKPGQYSEGSNYENVTSLKHDIFKQMTIDLLPVLLVFGLPSLIYYFAFRTDPNYIPIISFNDIISFETYKDFMNSILGKVILSALGYTLFYEVVQPNIINTIIPKF